MKKIIFTLIITLITSSSFSQISAITSNGDEVILNENGTWSYVNDSISNSVQIELNKKEFKKSKQSSFLVKSNKLNIGIWINPKKWNFKKTPPSSAPEYKFTSLDKDLYGMLISEKVSIPIENLKNIAFENAKSAGQDVKIVNQEFRMVNGIQVLMMQMTGIIQGIKFIYYGYYYSSENGVVQLLTYTSQNLFDEYEDEMEDLLNGFVVI